MRVSERLIYLATILLLILMMSYEFNWFTQHYEYLLEGFNIVWKNCKV